jgi:hypothetical protein
MASPDLFGIENLLKFPAILVRGRPWMGKTYLANEIRNQQSQLELGKYVWPLPLEDHTSGRSIEPGEWPQWRDGKDQAAWIIDSLDEGELLQPNISTEIIRLIKELDNAARQRLKVVVFGREAEIPQRFVEFLHKQYAVGFQDVELMPLDRDNARHMVGEQFDAVLSVIESRRLQGVCSIPAALRFIADHRDDADLSEEAVWRGVLENLLREKAKTPGRKARNQSEIDQLFGAAKRIAVILTFSDFDALGNEESTSLPSVGQLFNSDTRPGKATVAAARDAVQTEMFSRGRFAQKNIREWMCAFGLEDFGLERLRVLLTDENGKLQRNHWGVLSLLAKVGKPEVREWICKENGGVPPLSDLSTLTLQEVLRVVDRLEDIADNTKWEVSLWGDRGLRRLKVAGVGKALAERLADPLRSINQRSLLMQIALETESHETVPAARAIVEDPNCDDDFRYSALVLVLRLGTRENTRDLEPLVTGTCPRTPSEKKMISTIIRRYLDDGLWDVEKAAEYVPEPDDDVIDNTAVLIYRLKENMTVPAARAYVKRGLQRLKAGQPAPTGAHTGVGPWEDELLACAAQCLLTQEPPNESDLAMLVPLAEFAFDRPQLPTVGRLDFFAGFAKSVNLRRKLYLRGLGEPQGDLPAWFRRRSRWCLQAHDIEWLIEHLRSHGDHNHEVWDDLLMLAFQRTTPPRQRRSAKQFVRAQCPERLTELRRRCRESLRSERQQKKEFEELRSQREPPEVAIRDAVERLLGADKISSQERMWRLSWICFSDDQGRPRNVIGKWGDLSPLLQSRVLGACETALTTCAPTPIPAGSSFPATILYEAWCFRKLVTERQQSCALNAAVVNKWLPSMFVVSIDGADQVLAACYQADRNATEQVLIETIRREARTGGSGYMTRASTIGAEYWSDRVVKAVVKLFNDPRANELSLAELLRILARNSPTVAKDLARSVTGRTPHNELWYSAVDVLITLDVDSAWPHVEIAFSESGKDALTRLPSLYHHGIRAGTTSPVWPSDRLLELGRILNKAFPQEDDPEERSGWVTPEGELRELRARIPRLLFQRGPGDCRRALEELVDEFGYLREWLTHADADEAAHGEIARISVSAPSAPASTSGLPLQQVLQLLDNADYRVVRNNDDLLEVVYELLHRIGKEVGKHIEVLYSAEKGGGHRRQHESALQCYAHCRLQDLIPARILEEGAKIVIHREPQGRLCQRTDIEIVAPLVRGGLGTVVIEVKWSDNPDVSKSQVGQLGTEYLLKSGKTHGIYLVGWMGELAPWSRNSGHGPKRPATLASLEEALIAQAAGFSHEHQEIAIRPILFDLEWPEPAKKNQKRNTRRTK